MQTPQQDLESQRLYALQIQSLKEDVPVEMLEKYQEGRRMYIQVKMDYLIRRLDEIFGEKNWAIKVDSMLSHRSHEGRTGLLLYYVTASLYVLFANGSQTKKMDVGTGTSIELAKDNVFRRLVRHLGPTFGSRLWSG